MTFFSAYLTSENVRSRVVIVFFFFLPQFFQTPLKSIPVRFLDENISTNIFFFLILDDSTRSTYVAQLARLAICPTR